MKGAAFITLLLLPCSVWAIQGQQSGDMKLTVQGGEAPQGAKENKAQPAQPQKAEKKPLTNADVISMVKAGLSESTVVLAIQHSATNFDTSAQALIALTNQGVPQKVLDAMLTAGSEQTTSPAEPSHPAATTHTGSSGNGKWEVTEQVSPMDGSRTVVLILQAEQEVPGLVGLDRFPRLYVDNINNFSAEEIFH